VTHWIDAIFFSYLWFHICILLRFSGSLFKCVARGGKERHFSVNWVCCTWGRRKTF